MTRTQIIALSLGAGLVAVGGVLAWQGLLPGMRALPPQIVSQAPLPAKSSGAPKLASSATAQTGGPAPVTSKRREKPAIAAAADNHAGQAVPARSAVGTPAPAIPGFDTVRVEPSGESVVAGHGAPGAKIDLMAGAKVIGEAKAGPTGDFVIVPQALAPGNYVLALRSKTSGVTVQSHQTITVSVPAKGQKGVAVALTEPGKASVLLADPTAKSAAKPPANPAATAKLEPQGDRATSVPAVVPAVAFKTAEADKGGFYASGIAAPGTHVRIYLNGSRLADVVADAGRHWSMTIGKGMTAGHYTVRADAVDASGKVIARAEVPFDMPVAAVEARLERKVGPEKTAIPAKALDQTATASPGKSDATPIASPQVPAAATSARDEVAAATPPQAASSSVVVPEISTAAVQRGDSLWRISRKVFGHGIRYTLIYAANASQIRDPNLIYPGQVFVLPHDDH